MNKSVLLSAVLLLSAAGCANDPAANSDQMEEKYTRTGTNIPERTRAGVVTMNPEDFERRRTESVGTTVKDPAKGR